MPQLPKARRAGSNNLALARQKKEQNKSVQQSRPPSKDDEAHNKKIAEECDEYPELMQEKQIRAWMERSISLVFNFLGLDSEECAPDHLDTMTHTLLEMMMTSNPYFSDEVEHEDPSSGDLQNAIQQWGKLLKFDAKVLEKKGINGNKRSHVYMSGGPAERTIRGYKRRNQVNAELAARTASNILGLGFMTSPLSRWETHRKKGSSK